MFVTYAVVSYVTSFRGVDGFMLDLGGLRKNRERCNDKKIWIVLLGKLKGENLDREHFVTCANGTKSGIKVNKVVQRVIQEKEYFGLLAGPAISNHQGEMCDSRDIDGMMHEISEEIFDFVSSRCQNKGKSGRKLPMLLVVQTSL